MCVCWSRVGIPALFSMFTLSNSCIWRMYIIQPIIDLHALPFSAFSPLMRGRSVDTN